MNRINCKLTAIILITVIFISIFFVGLDDYSLNKMQTVMYPVFENTTEEDLNFTEEIIQIFNWNKNIFLRFDTEYILLSIAGLGDLNSIKLYNLKSETLDFLFYSVLIVVFINKKDGKKDIMFISYHI